MIFAADQLSDEIPLTYMHIFYAGAELRSLISSMECPDLDEFHDVLEALRNAYKEAPNGSRVVDALNAIPVPQPSYDKLFDTLDRATLDSDLYNMFTSLMTAVHDFSALPYVSFDSDADTSFC